MSFSITLWFLKNLYGDIRILKKCSDYFDKYIIPKSLRAYLKFENTCVAKNE